MSDQIFDSIQAGDIEAIRSLVGGDPQRAAARNAQGVSAVMLARYYGRRDIAELLESTGITLDLFEAAAAGRVDTVAGLLRENAALANAYSGDGFNVLGLASFFGHAEIVRLLVDRGADVNAVARNNTGYTALTAGVASSKPDVVEILLEHGANAAYRYGPGYTPLHEAASSGHLAIARMLVSHGADPRATTDDGKAPRQLAEEKGHNAVAEWLKEVGG